MSNVVVMLKKLQSFIEAAITGGVCESVHRLWVIDDVATHTWPQTHALRRCIATATAIFRFFFFTREE